MKHVQSRLKRSVLRSVCVLLGHSPQEVRRQLGQNKEANGCIIVEDCVQVIFETNMA